VSGSYTLLADITCLHVTMYRNRWHWSQFRS